MGKCTKLTKSQFRQKLRYTLNAIGQDELAYSFDEFWMIERLYSYIEFYANENMLYNTAVALPLSRALHDGTYRKATINRGGKSYRLPYVFHCLSVCRMLIDLELPLPEEEIDIILAASLCHDMIEDLYFAEGGKELVSKYKLDPRVYQIVQLVTKRKGATEEELQIYFDRIQVNEAALLVKLADRANNVEDLYNMKTWKVHEYVRETNRYFISMADYGFAHYDHLFTCIELLIDKIKSLTHLAETFVHRYEKQELEMVKEVQELHEENTRLWSELRKLQDSECSQD